VLFNIVEELERTGIGRCQWVAATSCGEKSDFVFYVNGPNIVAEWKGHLSRAYPGHKVDFALEEDGDHKWFGILRNEAEQAAADASRIANWTRDTADPHCKATVRFRIQFPGLAQAQDAQVAVDREWKRSGGPTNADTLLTDSDEVRGWTLIIIHTVFVNANMISTLRRVAQDVALRFGGRYVGWITEP
jgi:hypothetical protein